MRSRTILALAAAGILAAACASTTSTSTQGPTAVSKAAAPTASVAPTTTPAETTAPAADPTATPVPQTDGEGDEYVVGTLADPNVTKDSSEQQVGDQVQYRNGLIAGTQAMNDRRVTGSAQWEINLDLFTKAARQWGTYTLTNAGGSWAGRCTGGAWRYGPTSGPGYFAWGCWLAGSGDYEGYTFFQTVIRDSLDQAPVVRGVIFKGTPPKV